MNTKYHITKADGRAVDPQGIYLVLKLNSDNDARRAAAIRAALLYSEEIEDTEGRFARDLRKQCLSLQVAPHILNG